MEALKIVLLSIGAALLYGILHDQITARVCVEYFTIGHEDVFGTDSPTLLAFGWGILATWWMGLFLGVPLAVFSRAGHRRKLTARDLLPAIRTLLIVMALSSLMAGLMGFVAAKLGWVWLAEPFDTDVPEPKHARFLADLWAHLAAYGVGFWGGVIVWAWAWHRRGRMAASLNKIE
jgi:hypothetical protein